MAETSRICVSEASMTTEAGIQEVRQNENAETPFVPEQFQVVDSSSANWLVRRIMECRLYRDRVDAWAAKEKRRSMQEEEFFFWKFGGELRTWATIEIAKFKGRRKSINLPGGTIGYRREGGRLVIDNETSVLAWARQQCPAAVKTTETIVRSVLSEHLQTTGELPPAGAQMEPEHDKFYVK